MSAIGGITVFSLRGGEPIYEAIKTRPVTREGVDGIAVAQLGTRAISFQQSAIMHVASGAVDTTHASFFSLEGTILSFVNDRGAPYNNYLLTEMQQPRARRLVGAQGGIPTDNADYEIQYFYTLTYVGT